MMPSMSRSHVPRTSITVHVRTPTTDIRKRMDDVYNELMQSSRNGQVRMPVQFVNFHESDVLYQFTRAAVGYALSYVKVKTLEKEQAERTSADELAKFHASQLQNQFRHDVPEQDQVKQQQEEREAWHQRMETAIASQTTCTTLLAETYARLVLHCSNFEHHKEDERFFECVYYFVCAVVKVGIAPDHWIAIENELGFLFRGTQFNATILMHSMAKTQRDQATAAAAVAAAASEAASGANTAAKKIQNLSAAGVMSKDLGPVRRDDSLFVLPTVPSTRCCFFPASLPVGKIVSELDAAKLRANRNIEISQSIRDRIRVAREDEAQRRQLDALVSPRANVRLDSLRESKDSASRENEMKKGDTATAHGASSLVAPLLTPHKPRRRPHVGNNSPRLSMKATFTSRSPAVNHLLPGTEDRVHLALEDYERSFQQNRQEQKRKRYNQKHKLDPSPTSSDLSSSASSGSAFSTPTNGKERKEGTTDSHDQMSNS